MEHHDLGTLIGLVKKSSFKDVMEALAGIAATQGDEASDMLLADKAISLHDTADILFTIAEEVDV